MSRETTATAVSLDLLEAAVALIADAGHLGTLGSMSAIGLRRQLVRRRRHLAVMAVVLALAALIAMHHSGMAIGDMHDEHGMSAAIELCLGVMTAVATAVTALALGVLAALGRSRPAPALSPAGLVLQTHSPIPRARAGPPLLSLLCVSRR